MGVREYDAVDSFLSRDACQYRGCTGLCQLRRSCRTRRQCLWHKSRGQDNQYVYACPLQHACPLQRTNALVDAIEAPVVVRSRSVALRLLHWERDEAVCRDPRDEQTVKDRVKERAGLIDPQSNGSD